MYKNRVKNDIYFLNLLLFYLPNKEIQSGKIQNNIYFFNFPAPFSTGFSRSQDKRAGISKMFLSFFTLSLYMVYPALGYSYTLQKFRMCNQINCPRETLQKLPYFWNKKTQIVLFFCFHFEKYLGFLIPKYSKF